MKTEAEFGVMHLQEKKHSDVLAGPEGRLLPYSFKAAGYGLPAPWFWPSCLQN